MQLEVDVRWDIKINGRGKNENLLESYLVINGTN
jgi:hypothetical protein